MAELTLVAQTGIKCTKDTTARTLTIEVYPDGTTLEVSVGKLRVKGGAAANIPAPAGGEVIDTQARAALASILALLVAKGQMQAPT